MAPKRNVSKANIESKKRRLENDIDELVTKQDELAFQADLRWVEAALKQHPHKMKSIKAMLKMDEGMAFDPATELSPDLLRRSVSRLPLWFLRLFLATTKLFSEKEVQAITKSDTKAGLHLLQRLCLLPLTAQIWSNKQKDLLDYFMQRFQQFRAAVCPIVFDAHYIISWSQSGVYKLLPLVAEHAEQDEDTLAAHVFTNIAGLGREASLQGVYIVRGNWYIERNWDPCEAVLVCPSMPSVRPLCIQFFGASARLQLEPEAAENGPPALPAPMRRLAIADHSTASSSSAPPSHGIVEHNEENEQQQEQQAQSEGMNSDEAQRLPVPNAPVPVRPAPKKAALAVAAMEAHT